MSSCRAPAYSVPEPATMIGLLAAPSRCTISWIRAGSGLARSTGYGSTSGMSAVSSSISRGSDTTTGPGRPLRERWNARLSTAGTRRGSLTSITHLARLPKKWV